MVAPSSPIPPSAADLRRELLARYLRGQRAAGPPPAPVPVAPQGPETGPVPLSPAQEQVWLHAQLAPDLPVYNEPVTIHYRGPFEPLAFERAFNEILRRHQAWRTRFEVVEGEPRQRVEPELLVRWPVADLTSWTEAERESEVVRRATADARDPLDWNRAPLFRAQLFRLEESEHRLYLTLCHILFDGVALYQVFLPELAVLYDAFVAGRPSPLADPPLQYPDYARRARAQLTPETLAPHLAYWRRQLSPPPPALEWPGGRARLATQSFRGAMLPFRLSPVLTAAIRQLSHRLGTTLFQTLLAGFAALLGRTCDQTDLAIGTVASDRDQPGAEAMLGYCLKTLPLRLDLTGDPSFGALAAGCRDVVAGALEHSAPPFNHILRALGPRPGANRLPLFQTLFSLDPPLAEVGPAWALEQTDLETTATKYELHLELCDRGREIRARLHYASDLWDPQAVADLATRWQALLAAAAEDPSRPIGQLPLTPLATPRATAGPTAVELRLIALWREILGTDGIQAADHFFALGGHSLLAMRLLHQISLAFGVELPAGTLLATPTVRGLAAAIAAAQAGRGANTGA